MTKAKKDSTVLWWIGWITLTLLSFFLSAYVWTGVIARFVGPMSRPGVPILWVTTVFGTWLLLLLPLIIVMYSKVDKTYEDSRHERETRRYQAVRRELGVRSVDIDERDRLLPKPLSDKLRRAPQTIHKGHLVTAVLKNGRHIPNVFVYNAKDVLGVYGLESLDFRISDIVDLLPAAPGEPITPFTAEGWLRFDGVGTPVGP